MRRLVTVALLLAALYAGYWFVVARGVEQGAAAWFASETAGGRVAERESLTVQGFPGRFDLTVTGLSLADPATGFGWQVPELKMSALPWKPWQINAVLPPQQVIATPFGEVVLEAGRLGASVAVAPGTDLPLDRLSAAGDTLRATGSTGWTMTAERFALSSQRQDASPTAHDIAFEAAAVTPDPAWLGGLPEGMLTPAVELLRAAAVLHLTAPLDRYAGETRPQIAGLDVTEALIRWGDMTLTVTGSVTTDAAGLAEGRMEFRLANWRKALDVAVALGLVTPEVAPTWANALTLLSVGSADVTLPLSFANGRMSLGPLPLGPAPRLR